MEYECGPVLLYSKDKVRMMDLFSDVFEFDVDSEKDSAYSGSLHIKICDLEKSTDSMSTGIIFSFKVKSELELKEIMSKYNFFIYRKTLTPDIPEKLELQQTETKKILTISDIDQRLWRFEFSTKELPSW